MTALTDMLQSHPQKPTTHMNEISAAIDACFEAEKITTICADACIAEKEFEMLRECIRLDLDCADICSATGRLIARQAQPKPDLWRAALQACIEVCRACAAECGKHADRFEHCRITKECCERTMQACQRALDALPQGGAETRH